jgi:hypothetical protein
MGLKGYRLWVNLIQRVEPHRAVLPRRRRRIRRRLDYLGRLVARLQRRLVPGLSLTPGGCQIGYMGDQNSTYGSHSLPGGVRLVTCATRTPLMGRTHSRGVSDWLHVRPELHLWVALTPGGCQIGYMGDQNSTYGLHSLPGGVRLVTWTPYWLSSVEPCFDAQ